MTSSGNGHRSVSVDTLTEFPADGADPGQGPIAARRRRRRNPLSAAVAALRDLGELRRTPYGMKPAMVVGAALFLQTLSEQSLFVVGPEIVRTFGLDIETLLRIVQFVGFFAIFASLFVGWYLDRHRRLPFFAGGAIATGAMSVVSAGAVNGLTLGVPRVAGEAASRGTETPAFSLLSDYYPRLVRGKAFAFMSLAYLGGALLAAPISGGLTEAFGVRVLFVVIGGALAAVGVAAAVLLREPVRGYFERQEATGDESVALTEDEPLSFGESWRTTWSVRTLRRTFYGAMILSPAGRALQFFIAFLMFEQYGLSAWERSILTLPAAAAGAVSALIGGGLVDRLSRSAPGRALAVYGLFTGTGAIALIGFVLTPPLPVLAVLLALYFAGTSLVGPALYAVISQVVPPTIRTQGLQIFTLHQLPGLLIGLGVFNAVYTAYGYPGVWIAAIPTMMLGAFVISTAGQFFELDRRNALAAAVAAEEWRRTVAEGGAKLLVCRDVDVSYNGVQVLFGVDFDVEEGEIIALLGTNGAGKSTLLRAISGTQEASAGAIVFDGRDITHMPPHEVAQRGVIHMPGGRGVFPGLTVADNLLLGAWMVPDGQRDARLAEVYELFPVLRQRAGTPAAALSGGEQQQLSLAQAFLGNPKLLMIDELSLGLAPSVVAELLDSVRRIHARGTTVIIVEQSVNVALTIASRAIFMEKGEVKFFGPTEELLSRPDVLRAVYVKGTGALTQGATVARRTSEEQRRLQIETAPTVLSVEGIVKRYGGVTALDGVNVDVKQGSVLGVIGPNGSGKTTLFDVVSGFVRPDAGRIVYLGADVTTLPPAELASRGLVRRFQDARLFPSLTVYETLLVALDGRLAVRNPLWHAVRLPQARTAETRLRVRADRLVELLELGAYRDKFVKELSTGLRRIVDIACTLATEPKVLLLDEPSSGIAQAEAEGLAPLLRRIRHETGCTMLVIEHDMPLLSRVADELLVLTSGSVLTRGTPEAVLADERVITAYLGTSSEAVRRSGGVA